MELAGVTIAICTRNRASLLEGSIRAAIGQALADCQIEVLVVDNGSTDGTPALITKLLQEFPQLKAANEERAGLSIARNRALREATQPVIIFVDDDGILCPGYIAALREAWEKWQPTCAGGPIKIEYLDEPPPGWSPSHEIMRGEYNKGNDPKLVKFGDYPEGCNIAFDRAAAIAAGGFNEKLGVKPDEPWAGEETELCARLEAAGKAILYHPALLVTHRQERRERSRRWLWRMAVYRGRSHFYSCRSYFGKVRWRLFFRLFFEDGIKAFPWYNPRGIVRLGMAWGKLREATCAWLKGELQAVRR